MNFSDEMDALAMRLEALHLNDDSTQMKISTNKISTPGKNIPQMRPRQERKPVRDDSARTLRTSNAASSAATRLKMWKAARTSKTAQRKKQKKQIHGVPNVWIIGSSYISRGEWAAHKRYGENFGLNAKVKWLGKGGMRWEGVLPRFYEELSTQRPPDVLVIHAGGNDLGLSSPQEIFSTMMHQLIQLHADYPAMKIAFSVINERQVWRYGKPSRIDRNRKFINSSIRKTVDSFGGVIIEHPQLKFYKNELFLRDGVHFTQRGNELFLKSIRFAIKRTLQNMFERT